MIIKNLTPIEAGSLEEVLTHFQKENPLLRWQSFIDDVQPHPIHHQNNINEVDQQQLKRIEEKLDKLLTRLDLIFGDHALVNGKFVHIADMHHG